MEVYGINDLALVLFDCINNDGMRSKIVVKDELEYRKVMDDLMAAHEEAPLTGLDSFCYEKRMIIFDSGSVLYFDYESKNTDSKPKAEPSECSEPVESLNDFLGKFNVKS